MANTLSTGTEEIMKSCILILLFSIVFLLSGEGKGQAKVIYRTVQAIGHGPNFEKATDRALLNAITQVRGAEMATRARSSMPSSRLHALVGSELHLFVCMCCCVQTQTFVGLQFEFHYIRRYQKSGSRQGAALSQASGKQARVWGRMQAVFS